MGRGTELVERLGGAAGVRKILVDFYGRLAADVIVGFHFAGFDLETIVDGQLGFLLKAFGVAGEFRGRHPRVAHRKLAPILRGQFDRRLVILEETLRDAGLSEEERELWLGVERSMRASVQRGNRE